MADPREDTMLPGFGGPGRLAVALSTTRLLAHKVRKKLDGRQKALTSAFADVRLRFYRDFWERTASEVGGQVEHLERGYARICRGGRATFVRSGVVMLDTALGFRLSEDKPLVLGLMRDLGARTVPHARFSLSRLDRAEAFLREVGGSVVVKPAAGTGAGAGVTTGIHTGRGLRQAALIAAGFHEQLLVEQEITGSSYRLLYLGGELIDVIRRDPPSVEGDGAQTIRRLLDTENTRRLEADPIVSLHPITADVECRTELRRQGRTLDSIPDRGERLAVKKVVNQNASRDNHRILSEVHPSLRDEGRRLSAALGLDLVGVDILADDLGVPLADSGGFISELNAAPGLHHHVLVADPGSANVGATILEYVFAHGGTVPAHIRGE